MATSSSSFLTHSLISTTIPPTHNTKTHTSDHLTFISGPTRCLTYLRQTQSSSRRVVVVKSSAQKTIEKVTDLSLVDKSVNTIRFLAVDAVEKANSGHPGLPMGCAPMGHILFDEVMKYNPKNPYWFNRDRFVLSAGHGCMLHYALLHLAGYDSVKVV